MDFSQRIKSIREGKGLSQTEVANRLETERSNYHRLENRGEKLTFEQIKQIANALDVPFWDLLADSNGVVQQPIVDFLKEENKKLLYKLADIEDDKKRLKKEIKNLEVELNEISKKNEGDYIRKASLIFIPIIFKKFKEKVKLESSMKREISDEVYSIFEELISVDKGLHDLQYIIKSDWDINESHITSLMDNEKFLISILDINKEEGNKNFILLFKEQYFKFLSKYIEEEYEQFKKDFND